MPKEAKKRGRRAEKARKKAQAQEQAQTQAQAQAQADAIPGRGGGGGGGGGGEGEGQGEGEWGGEGGYSEWGQEEGEEGEQFYGLLTEQEQEYFRQADGVLDANSFSTFEERELFVANVWKEAHRKELKIASSQGCSRLLEKLILAAGVSGLKGLWKAFSGHFLHLVRHRFASHCCEMLFSRSVVVAAAEVGDGFFEGVDSMEELFLSMLNELEPHVKGLCTDRFASHTVRGLLLLLSGLPISTDVVQSRKKEKVTISPDMQELPQQEAAAVPQSFHDAVERITDATARDMSTEEVRAMAVHQIGSPALQVLLQLEMRRHHHTPAKRQPLLSREVTLLGKLTGITNAADTDAPQDNNPPPSSSSFFNNLIYDPIGSHLAEKIMLYAPKREFKKLYAAFFETRMGSLARNETAGFVVQRVLEKLDRGMLEEAVREILPQVGGLIERSQVAVVKTLIDRCAKLGVEAGEIAEAMSTAYDCPSVELILKILKVTLEELSLHEDAAAAGIPGKARRDPAQRYGSLLAQSMLQLPGKFHQLIADSLLAQDPSTILALCHHPQASHLIQAFLTCPLTTPPQKRLFLHKLTGSFLPLALHPSGSHIVDVCWPATHAGMMHVKQGIAAELLAGESQMRESFFGRTVWRNWGMDKFKMNKKAWFAMAGGAAGLLDSIDASHGKEKKKTPIELARERHAAAVAAKKIPMASGGNSVATGLGNNKRPRPIAGPNAVGGSKKPRTK